MILSQVGGIRLVISTSVTIEMNADRVNMLGSYTHH